MSPAGLVNRARGEEQVEGKEQVGGSRAGREEKSRQGREEQVGGSRAGRGT